MKVYTYNDKVLTNSANGKWLKKCVDPYNPLGLDSGVFRIKVTPDTSAWAGVQTATLVTGTTDVYDVQFTEADTTVWNKSMALEVLGANTTGWTTGFANMFGSCIHLTSVPLFDTSSATDMSQMFDSCYALTAIPLFDTSSVTNMSSMYSACRAVQSGALALYQQASTQSNPPTNYTNCFKNCGEDTVTGAAELAQIPESWGGTGA